MDVFASDNWIAADQISFDIDISSILTFHNGHLIRQKQNHDTHVWVKLCCQSLFMKIGLKKLVVHSNARFVELYCQEEKSLTYVSTIRGATGSDRFVFELDFETQLRFNQLHLKFLSIKSHSAKPFEKDVLELKISLLELYLEPDHNLQGNQIVSNIPYINKSSVISDNSSGDNGSCRDGEINNDCNTPTNTASIQQTNSPTTVSTTSATTIRPHQKSTTSVIPPTNTRPPGGMDIRDMLLQEMNKAGISPTGTNHYIPTAAVGSNSNGINGNNSNGNSSNGANGNNDRNVSNGNFSAGNNSYGIYHNNHSNANSNSNNSNNSANSPFAGQSTAQLMSLMLQMKSSMLSEFSGILDAKLTPVINRLDRIESNVNKIQDALFNADISSA